MQYYRLTNDDGRQAVAAFPISAQYPYQELAKISAKNGFHLYKVEKIHKETVPVR